ncbi:MAG: FAD-dependent thymidylate synthase [Endomicrobium sp.]|jgi:thymidylate synthase (FAD)|nr:FAD-dependent thymidylate synthase [Endomicrobium sp.]
MHIKILKSFKDAEKICALAARLCYSSDKIDDINKDITGNIKNLLHKIISSEHYSVLEHVSFTFGVEGVSRSLLAQLTRHRIASFSVQSQRYVKFNNGVNFVVPDTIKKCENLLKKYNSFLKSIEAFYMELLDAGIPAEDARYILPNAATTQVIITMNARELRHFFSLRCCNRSQWEIRKMACTMLNLVKKEAPLLFEDAGPDCLRERCREVFNCGKPWKK